MYVGAPDVVESGDVRSHAESETRAETPKTAAKVFLVARVHSRFLSTLHFWMFIFVLLSPQYKNKLPEILLEC